MNNDFLQELQTLQNQFDALEPKLQETIKDDEQGVEGYIVVWNTDIGTKGPLGHCGKGGTRITPNVTLDEVKMLARKMALKNAAIGLPLGGSKAGLKAHSDEDGFEKKYRRFVSLSKPYLHENGGVFGGFGFDLGARPIHPHWACDELGTTRSFTGKPFEMGGTDYDKEGVAGLGVATAALSLLEIKNIQPSNTQFSVQGIGAMGSAVIRYFTEKGGILKSISDPRINGTWTFEKGAEDEIIQAIVSHDIEKVNALLHANGHHHAPDIEAVLYHETDILFPCAIHDVIRVDNLDKVKAKTIVEGANSPCTPEAHQQLFDRGITVIPDIIANSGGIIAAYVEMINELSGEISIEENLKTRSLVEKAKSMTRSRIDENVKKVMQTAEKHGVSPHQSAFYIALSNIFE